ncbi:Putative PAT complex subunit CCDC47 protein [Septoria linicola]|uniref:PAT complex subunit CCDC47 protein n=1 Tax=Septoria linicola TaxID=215465 RepID=A0A9Q9AVK4_9PEZI|nr:putative PAT complex subunit CCDC47 protein [Septoria linicola]USW52903.1 Putative PAT complex subunit CCDC47 protein [Septoria linicola]
MAGFLKNLQGVLGGAKSSVASVASSADADDFADFATAASPVAPSHAASAAFEAVSARPTPKGTFSGLGNGLAGRPYTKWYRVWERVTIADFYQELFIIPVIIVVILVNLWGSRANKKRAAEWAAGHLPHLEREFAAVGFGAKRADGQPGLLWKEKSKNEYSTYATGRQNVAYLDVKLTLYKRYNPFLWFGELVASFLVDSVEPPQERLEATAYAFDGREKSMVPAQAQNQSSQHKDSTFDGFVWAIVHKDKMRQLRNDRYDVSLATQKDHPKLPQWATVMSESAEITEALLTPELVKVVTAAGDDLEALIITDQPVDAPSKLNELIPKKRVQLLTRLSTSPAAADLFAYFLRLPDQLVTGAHFRPEALRKVRATREEEIRKIRKIDDDEKALERREASDKLKKEERDRKLSRMSADDQKKFLEKEKEKTQRKQTKKQTMRG